MNAALETVLAKFPDAKQQPDGQYKARCPAHEDKTASLLIGTGNNGGAVLVCFAGCANADIVKAAGLKLLDLMPPKDAATADKWEEVPGSRVFDCAYDYTSDAGEVLYQSVRFRVKLQNTATGEIQSGKTFSQRRTAKTGEPNKFGFVSKMAGVDLVLYRLPDVLKAAQENKAVFVVEGEKDAENLFATGLVATTNVGGAGKWKAEYSQTLRGVNVVILPDNDAPGKKHAATVAAALDGVAASVRVLELPGLPEKGDVSDWLAAGGTADALRELARAAPLWKKQTPTINAGTGSKAEPGAGEPFHATDTGNGKRLAKRHGRDLRFCAEWGRWLVWNGRIFEPDPAALLVMVRAKETALSIYGEAANENGADDVAQARRKELSIHARRTEAADRLNAMITLARSEPGVPVRVKELDANRWLLCCDNGTIDLQTGTLRAHLQADLITKKAGCAFLPDAPAPRWEAFLQTVLPDADVRAFFQRAVGYALTGDVSEQCLFFLYGSGSNGKSTALRALLDAMGDYALQAAPDLLISKEKSGSGPNNDVADLQGARLVATVEVEDGQRMAEGLVKQITGGDKIKARFMRQDYFEFEPSHKIFLAANHQPTIRGQDYAIWRRIKVLPFTVQIADDAKDPTLPDKLREELPGILAWAVRGCLEWRKSGLCAPKAVNDATEAYRGDMDVLRNFIEDCCVLRPSLTVTAAALSKAYSDWCEANGEKPLGPKNFNARLKEHKNLKNDRVPPSWGRGWVGIALRSDREPSSDFALNADTSDTSDTKNHISRLGENLTKQIPEIVSEVSEVSENTSQSLPTETAAISTLLAFVRNEYKGTGADIQAVAGRVAWIEKNCVTAYWSGPKSGRLAVGVDYWQAVSPFPLPADSDGGEPGDYAE